MPIAKQISADLINLFGYSLREGASEWFSNYLSDYPLTTFDALTTAFRKRYRMINSKEEAYRQLNHLTQQIGEKVEAYYKRLMKIAHLLEMRQDDRSLITYFRPRPPAPLENCYGRNAQTHSPSPTYICSPGGGRSV